MSLSHSSRFNWFPDATAALEKMRFNRDKVQSHTSNQIGVIQKLQSYVTKYLDKTVQENVDELLRNLGKVIRQATKEMSELYAVSKTFSSGFLQAYESIEAKAKKARRLPETEKLLKALKQASETHARYHRSLETLIMNQRNLLPVLKEQTRNMQVRVQQGDVVEIGRLVNHHTETLLEIDGHTLRVIIEVKELLNIVGSDSTAAIKKRPSKN